MVCLVIFFVAGGGSLRWLRWASIPKHPIVGEVLKYLTQEEVENKTASGKVGFAVNYNGKPAAEVEEIGRAHV